jgi:hypothetical protein
MAVVVLRGAGCRAQVRERAGFCAARNAGCRIEQCAQRLVVESTGIIASCYIVVVVVEVVVVLSHPRHVMT